MAVCAAEQVMSVVRRRRRVSSRLALMTQWIAVRRYPAGCASNQALAALLLRSAAAKGNGSTAAPRSNE